MPWLRPLVLACLLSHAAVHADPLPEAPVSEPVQAEQWMSKLQGVGRETGNLTTRLVTTAMGMVGVPYRRGGDSVQVGFDCSGLVRAVYEQTLGLVLPHRAADQAKATEKISKDELQPGDLVFFNTMRRAFSHVGIYIGNGKFIHAPRTGEVVRVEDMTKAYWVKRFNGASRVEPQAEPL